MNDVLSCPKCGAGMVLKTARKGKFRGKQFYSCSTYPACKGIIDINEVVDTGNKNTSNANVNNFFNDNYTDIDLPVFLQAREKFPNYQVRFYETLAVSSEALEDINIDGEFRSALSKFSQWRLDYPINESFLKNEDIRQIILIAHKILTRGHLTMTSPHIEESFQNYFDIHNCGSDDSDFNTYLGYINIDKSSNAWFDGLGTEKDFYENILSDLLGKYYKSFVLPQVHLSSLIDDNTSQENQRVDFFINIEDKKIVIELDGIEHRGHELRDASRKELLINSGFEVIIIGNDEIKNRLGPNLQRLYDVLDDTEIIEINDFTKKERFFNALKISHQIQLTIIEAILSGHLDINDKCNIYFDWTSLNSSKSEIEFILNIATTDLKQLLMQISNLYQVEMNLVNLKSNIFDHDNIDYGIVISYNENLICNVPKFIIQDITFPSVIAHYDRPTKFRRINNATESNLEYFLNYIFRYTKFWEGQYEAISRALSGNDAIVLLPTGSGKSVVFQLTSFLLAGVTIVVDPIKSLINDQIDNLELIGIDRVVGITSQIINPNIKAKIIEIFGQGEYIFCYIAPERFQMQQYREALKTLTVSTPISLIVIDEAHCVSEWGHDFRTSYLNIGRISREFCKFEGNVPPLLALTGTASNSVLKDVQRELNILDFDAIITPSTFDREELNFQIYNSNSSEKFDILRGYLQRKLPDNFGVSSSSFYQINGKNTFSGLIFCPHVGGSFGIVENSRNISDNLGILNKFYAGEKPKKSAASTADWESYKLKTAKDFKNNMFSLLVATKAFGMGIDKPNVRYTIHYGMPNSIESFYQESGRAGRDRRKAMCCILLSNDYEDRSRRLLNPDTSIQEIDRIMTEERDWNNDDDITRAMFFHTRSFRGVDNELKDVDTIIEDIQDFSRKQHHIIFYHDRKNKNPMEKGIHRLLVLGVISDYTINYSSKEFTITLSGNTRDDIINNYLKYVSGYNKGRVAIERNKIVKYITEPISTFIKEGCRILIEFVYDTIEKGRRRALREILSLSESAISSNDPNQTIREGILRYLETTYSEEIEEILSETESFENLKKLVEGYVELETHETIGGMRSPRDAAEIRGQVSRYLESYPDHPGLLLLRAISEIYCPDSDLEIVNQNLIAAINFSKTRYLIKEKELYETLGWTFVLIYIRNSNFYSEVITKLLYEIDDQNFARSIMSVNNFDDEMLYEPNIFIFSSISKDAVTIFNKGVN